MSPIAPPVPRARTRWRFVLAAIACIALLGAFFSTPIAKYATHSYTAADLTQDYALTNAGRPHRPGNRLLSDPVTEMVPWLLFNRAEWNAGRVPLWNDRNACGAPHLANFQSAVFSPFSVPFYVMGLKPALLASAFLKLAAAALFTFLFLDLLGITTLAALIGTAAFTFSGHNTLLLSYPHAAAAIVLPAGLYFAQLALLRGEQGRGVLAACAGLAATFGIGLYCGQPEPLYFGVLMVALWTVTRLLGIAWREWLDRGDVRGTTWLAARILLAAMLGGAIGAPQILPFLEYLEHSTILVLRSADQTPLKGITWPLYAFPDLLGNPSRPYNINYSLPPPNYESANTCYIGAFAMLLAASALFFVRKSRPARFFVPVTLIWFLYAYDHFGASKLAALIPTLDLAPINRSQPVGLFAMSACAALAVHGIATLEMRARWRWALFTFLAGSGALWFTSLEAWTFFSKLRRSGYAKGLPAGTDAYVPEHMQYIVATFAVGLLALVAAWFVRAAWLQRALQAVMLAVVFLQSGWLLRDYNPTVPDHLVYPVTAAVEKLQRFARDEPVVILGHDTLPPHTNLVYNVRTLSSYDAMWVRKFDELYRNSFGEGGNWRLALQTSAKWMRHFGARLVLSPGPWVKVDSLNDDVLISPSDLYTVGEILPDRPVVQILTGQRELLQGVSLLFSAPPRGVRCTVDARLEDVISGQLLGARTWRTDDWRNDRFGRHEELLELDAPFDARHRPMRLTVRSSDATPGNAVTLWAREDYWYWNQFVMLQAPLREVIWNVEPYMRRPGKRPHGTLTWGDTRLRGGLVTDQAYDLSQWKLLKPSPGFTFALLQESVARYSTVSRGIATRFIGDDFVLVHHGNLDPRHVVVLSLPGRPAIDGARGRALGPEPVVEVLGDAPDRVELAVTRETPGYLVLRRTFYPGWHARVNGADAPLLRADYAFSAVELPAGASRVEVEYRPASFRNGLWIAGLGCVVGGALLVSTRRRGRIVPRAA